MPGKKESPRLRACRAVGYAPRRRLLHIERPGRQPVPTIGYPRQHLLHARIGNARTPVHPPLSVSSPVFQAKNGVGLRRHPSVCPARKPRLKARIDDEIRYIQRVGRRGVGIPVRRYGSLQFGNGAPHIRRRFDGQKALGCADGRLQRGSARSSGIVNQLRFAYYSLQSLMVGKLGCLVERKIVESKKASQPAEARHNVAVATRIGKQRFILCPFAICANLAPVQHQHGFVRIGFTVC